MNKEIKNNEICDVELEVVSGGAYTECNRGYTCPKCSSDNIRIFDQDGKLTYFCFACRQGGHLPPDLAYI